MPRYVAQHGYGAKYGEGYLGPWEAGTEVDLSEQEAGWVNRDSPGCLTKVPAAAPEPEPESEPTGADETAGEATEEAASDSDGASGEGGGDAEADTDPVPEGTAQVVLDWVGSDPDLARRALDAEEARDTPRSTLIAALERLAAPAVDRQHRGGFNRAT